MVDESNSYIMLTEFVVMFSCIVISAICSASETAITSLGLLKAKHLLEEDGGDKSKATYLRLWIDKPGHVLTTILIANNIVNILASVLATTVTIRYFGNYAVGIATGIMTFVILIFGEIVPKSYAKTHASALSMICLKTIYIVYKCFYPLVWFLSGFANITIKLLGGDRRVDHPLITEEELEFMIDESEAAGVLQKFKKDMISGVFEIDETVVREIMRPRTDINALDKEDSIDKAITLAIKTGHSRIPVYDDQLDNIVGILFVKDLLKYAISANLEGKSQVKLTDIMRKPFFVPESKPLMNVFRDLKRSKTHMAIVIDEHGGTAGLVTLEDIIEEIVGEIQDEYDKEESEITEVSSGVYDVIGSLNVEDFFEYFNMEEDDIDDLIGDRDQDSDTMSGFIISLIGDIPKVGQSVSVGEFTFKVSEVGQHRIKRFRVEYAPFTG